MLQNLVEAMDPLGWARPASEAWFRTRNPIRVLPLALVLLWASSAGAQGKAPPLDCARSCVCASNIVSCSRSNLSLVPGAIPRYTAVLDLSLNNIGRLRAEWTPVALSRLHTLLLNNNGLFFLSSEAFAPAGRLRHLDLSSNRLRLLDEFVFEPLERLEVLLLYNNCISQIDRTAFSGLLSLQKLYLSHNQISRFPLELVRERSRSEALRLLDVSSNRIKELPLQELRAVPAWLKDGLYFHNNSLPCSCKLHQMLARWLLKELSSAVDFRSSHTCVLPGPHKERAAILDLDKAHLNCSEVKVTEEQAFLEQFLVLDCDTRQKDVVKTWTLPGDVALSKSNRTAAAVALRDDGSLLLGPLALEDSGVYTCHAAGRSLNETLYLTVVVLNSTAGGGLESLKTAYTTLVACVVSVVMVLVYLYLTPCRCCPGDGPDKTGDSVHSSDVSVCQDGARDARFHYGDLKDQPEQNGRLNPIGEEDEEWQGDEGERRRSQSVSSVCSDTPMVV